MKHLKHMSTPRVARTNDNLGDKIDNLVDTLLFWK